MKQLGSVPKHPRWYRLREIHGVPPELVPDSIRWWSEVLQQFPSAPSYGCGPDVAEHVWVAPLDLAIRRVFLAEDDPAETMESLVQQKPPYVPCPAPAFVVVDVREVCIARSIEGGVFVKAVVVRG